MTESLSLISSLQLMSRYSPHVCSSLLVGFLLVGFLGVRPASGQGAGFYPMQQMHFLSKMNPDIKRIGVLWKKGVSGQEQKLSEVKRAIASVKGKLFIAYVEGESDVAEKFRLLTGQHDVDALWVVENDGVVDASAPKQYLVKNAVKEGVPLLAPSKDWVSGGAPVAVAKSNGSFQIVLNEGAAQATGLKVPSQYQNLVAAAN